MIGNSFLASAILALPVTLGDVAEGPRKEFFYFTDGGDLNALRYGEWKISFKTVKGNLFTGSEESTNVPLVTNLRQDPWERYRDLSMNYGKWWDEKLWTMVPAVNIVTIPDDLQGISTKPGVGNADGPKGGIDDRAWGQRRRQVVGISL